MPEAERVPSVFREFCGTMKGYNRHLKEREKTCEQCRAANAASFRHQYARNPQAERDRFQRNIQKDEYRKRKAIIARRVNSRRRTRLRGLPQERYTEAEVLELYGSDCHICKLPVDLDAPRRTGWGENWQRGLQLDHLMPIAEGGSDTLANVRPSHGLCNLSKGKKYAVPVDPESAPL